MDDLTKFSLTTSLGWLELIESRPLGPHGMLHLSVDEFAALRRFYIANRIKWPKDGIPMIFGRRCWRDETL